MASWREDQGVDHYDEMNLEWKTMMLRRGQDGGPVTDEKGNKLFHMVMYDLDQFRRFVFKSRFLEVFQVDEDVQERIWDDDEELLKFGYQYMQDGPENRGQPWPSSPDGSRGPEPPP